MCHSLSSLHFKKLWKHRRISFLFILASYSTLTFTRLMTKSTICYPGERQTMLLFIGRNSVAKVLKTEVTLTLSQWHKAFISLLLVKPDYSTLANVRRFYSSRGELPQGKNQGISTPFLLLFKMAMMCKGRCILYLIEAFLLEFSLED